MCRLFGIIANRPVDIQFSFFGADKPFVSLTRDNPHGWGIGWYENGVPKFFKEGKEDQRDYRFERVKSVNSKIIVSHVRHATNGAPTSENAHPFVYKNFVFAHNGGVDRIWILENLDNRFKKELNSQTDSEAYFLLIMQFLEKTHDMVDSIRSAVKVLKKSYYSGLNFILSNGNNLYAFRDASSNRNHYTLYFLKRCSKESGPYEHNSSTGQLIRSKSLWGEEAVLISSEKLTDDEKWEELKLGELLVVDSNLDIQRIVV
ncbi:MAG: class II glutamine amidotransferase [Methanomassiliicoccales archaeon]